MKRRMTRNLRKMKEVRGIRRKKKKMEPQMHQEKDEIEYYPVYQGEEYRRSLDKAGNFYNVPCIYLGSSQGWEIRVHKVLSAL